MIDDSDAGSPPDTGSTARVTTGGRNGDRLPAASADTPPAVDGASTARPGTMTITFKLYATLQDLLPSGAVRNAVPISVPTDTSLNDVIDRFKVPRELAHLVLVNGVFACEADRDARGSLKPDDVLAIWPPVAGG